MEVDEVHRLEIVPYDESWPDKFRAEAARLLGVLGRNAVRIEHNGSTSVPGLAAKPTVDILISVPALSAFGSYADPITSLGYAYRERAEALIGDDQRFFRLPDSRPFHIHVCEAEGTFEREHLIFRDFLRAHPDVAAEYGRLKQHLAAELGHDRPRYIELKAPFIKATLKEALAWAEGVNWRPPPRLV